VDDATRLLLLDVNKQFYQTFALPFSATRRRIQPGVLELLERIEPTARLLDLGCGTGTLVRELIRRNFRGIYVGLDQSESLLHQARQTIRGQVDFNYHFLLVDLSGAHWDQDLPISPFDIGLAFAFIHHLPGSSSRKELLLTLRQHLGSSGLLYLSNWQFLNSPRLRARIIPWEEIGLSAQEVEPGDYLLDWRHGGRGLRYVHHFSSEELASLAEEAGYTILESFHSDGENGRLGLYQVWETASS
jgi:tRNA (uracil-5-)-methyltransferase TRM9